MIVLPFIQKFEGCDIWTTGSNIYVHGANPNDLANVRKIINMDGIAIAYSAEAGSYGYAYRVDGALLLVGHVCLRHSKNARLVKGARCYKITEGYSSRDIFAMVNWALKQKKQPKEIRRMIMKYVKVNLKGPQVYSFRIY